MPKKSEKEIQDFFQALELGKFTLHPLLGYREVCDHVPSVEKKCRKDSLWQKNFVAWLSKQKRKANANLHIQPLDSPPAPRQPNPPVPGEVPAEVPAPEVPVGGKSSKVEDYPKPYKPPKERVRNHHVPRPAPEASSPLSPNSTESPGLPGHFVFEDNLWAITDTPPEEDTKPAPVPLHISIPPAPSPAVSPKKPSPKKPSPTKKQTPTMSSSNMMTPEERADAIIEKMAKDGMPSVLNLSQAKNHGIDIFQWPWPSETGSMHWNIAISGGQEAYIQPGGREVHVTIKRSSTIRSLMIHMRNQPDFAQKLCSVRIKKEFDRMHKYFDKMMNAVAFAPTVRSSSACLAF